MNALKPFLMLGCTAFTVGFMGYLGLVRMETRAEPPAVVEVQQAAPSTASAPSAADDWNVGKRI